MFLCGTCKKPLPILGIPATWEFCHCTTVTLTYTLSSGTTAIGFGEITNQPIICPGYEAVVARTEVPKAFYDAFEEDTKA